MANFSETFFFDFGFILTIFAYFLTLCDGFSSLTGRQPFGRAATFFSRYDVATYLERVGDMLYLIPVAV